MGGADCVAKALVNIRENATCRLPLRELERDESPEFRHRCLHGGGIMMKGAPAMQESVNLCLVALDVEVTGKVIIR